MTITQQQRQDLTLAAVDCEHQIDADCIRLYRDPTKAGSALSQMVDRVVAAIEQGAQPGADMVLVPRALWQGALKLASTLSAALQPQQEQSNGR